MLRRMVLRMARKKLDDMTEVELRETLSWYERQVRYIRWMLVDKFPGGNVQ